jgi:hypothetical protein
MAINFPQGHGYKSWKPLKFGPVLEKENLGKIGTNIAEYSYSGSESQDDTPLAGKLGACSIP